MQEKKDSNVNFPERLSRLIDNCKLKQKDISDKTGISPSALVRYKTDRIPKSDELLRLSSFFDVSMEWLLTGRGNANGALSVKSEQGKPIRKHSLNPNENSSASPTKLIPVISWAHAGDAASYEELPESWQEEIPTTCRDERAFGLKLEGDSMSPRFHEGAELVVMPSSEAYSGQYVVVKFHDGGVLFRRLEIEMDVYRLVPENARYPVKEYRSGDFEWVYPVFGVFEKLMK